MNEYADAKMPYRCLEKKSKKAVTVKVPGACGELVQGAINGTPFLVTCPIDLWTAATVSSGEKENESVLGEKARRAWLMMCDKYNDGKTLDVSLTSQLVVSKGMASSSADIVAVCKAAAVYHGARFTQKDAAKLAASIEPTDGVFCRGIVKINHLTGEILEYLGEPPDVQIALFDCGGSVDTVIFNRRSELPQLNAQKENEVKKALELVKYGIKHRDVKALGEGVTMSAVANQHILYKKDLEDIIEITRKYSGIGVNIAHSGTLIGIMFDGKHADKMAECVEAVKKSCVHVKYMCCTKLISGGFFDADNKRLF